MNLRSQPQLIIAFVADLMFSTKIEFAATQLDYRVKFIERLGQVEPTRELKAAIEEPRQFAEHVVGPGAALLEKITHLQPALIIFDLSNPEIPWREWLPLVKSSPATRRISTICFGSHVDVESFKYAKWAGADAVLARSQFVVTLPKLLKKYARLPDIKAVDRACMEPNSASALRGLEEFNRGEYFEAHESLEEAWNADNTAGKELYRAILQVGVAYLQIERKNYPGAVKMFLRLRQWIAPLPDRCRGIDVAQLRKDAQRVYESLIVLGPDRIAEFDHNLFQPVRYELDY